MIYRIIGAITAACAIFAIYDDWLRTDVLLLIMIASIFTVRR